MRRLREHFQRFNRDVSEICQWLMALRPRGEPQNPSLGPLWDFFTGPAPCGLEEDEAPADRGRLEVFKVAAGWSGPEALLGSNIESPVRDAAVACAGLPRSRTAAALLDRLRSLSDPHVMILVKAASEWVRAHYRRARENWDRHHRAWQDEKQAWERANARLYQ